MTSQTKRIFLTSDEDLIRKISSNKSNNTHIIDLDDYEQVSKTLSQLNSTNDEVYRQVLDFIDNNQPKKSNHLRCKVCGDRAIGYNYDVLSCASCKAFFRRNAYKQPEDLICITGKGECLVVHGIDRQCHRCRLDRCLSMGMRKDFIVKREEKPKRKKRLEKNDNTSSTLSSNTNESLPQTLDEIDHLLLDLDNDMEQTVSETILSIEDLNKIQTIQSLFISNMQDANAYKFTIDISDRDAAILSCLQSADQTALRFINFFRGINEFESLNTDDRFILIKYNLLPVFPLYKCFNYRPENHYLSLEDNIEAIKFRQFWNLFDQSYPVRDTLIELVLSLVKLTEQDPTILSLLLIILVFSQGILINDNEPVLNDPLAVNRFQSDYIRLLWNYLISKRGEEQARKYFLQLLAMIFRLQSTSEIFGDFTRVNQFTRDSIEQIAPLMKTFLNIS